MHQSAGSNNIKNPMFVLQSAPNKSNYGYITFFFFSTFKFFLFFLFKLKRNSNFFTHILTIAFSSTHPWWIFSNISLPSLDLETIVICQTFGTFLKKQHLYVYLDRRSNHTSILY